LKHTSRSPERRSAVTRDPILIVDDEKSIRFMLVETLSAIGLSTEEAADGEEALAKLKDGRFSLVLLDLRLPGMDGMEVLRKMRQTRPEIPVLVITAYGTVSLAVEAMSLGAIDFVQKPFIPEEVRQAVTRALRKWNLHQEKASDYAASLKLAKESIKTGHFDAAEEHLKKAMSVDSARPEAFNILGAVLEMRGNRLEAQKQYRAAISLDPTYAPARVNLERSAQMRRTPVTEIRLD
jgi:two-component system, OmpR family, alkaline phosphatase synthesis response regulator PhoP